MFTNAASLNILDIDMNKRKSTPSDRIKIKVGDRLQEAFRNRNETNKYHQFIKIPTRKYPNGPEKVRNPTRFRFTNEK